jgi:hypothetical protein
VTFWESALTRRLLAMLALLVASPLHAQGSSDSVITSHGVCRLRARIPGFSDPARDTAYNRCALDRAPVPDANFAMPTSPFEYGGARGTFTVVVNEDGSVDSSLTRSWSISMDTSFYRQFFETIRLWRFVPGQRNGKAVRNGISLEVDTPQWRDDTLAAHVEWSYRTGTLNDTLLGRWIPEPTPPPYGEDRIDSVYVAMIRRLVAMQVVTRHPTTPHCLVMSSADRPRHARLSDIARRLVYGANGGGSFAPLGCESDSSVIHLTLPRVFRTERDRVVVHPTGDRLLEWPRDLEGASWKHWQGQCIGLAGGRGPASIDCQVDALWSDTGRPEKIASDPAPPRRATSSNHAPFQLRLRVTSRGAYWIDTLQSVVNGAIPSLSSKAVTDSLPDCGARYARSTQRPDDLVVFEGDPEGRDLFISKVEQVAGPIALPTRSGTSRSRPAKFTAFLLGDVGTRASAPITLSFPGCARTYVLDPARHTLAPQAHVRFRVRDLRNQTRVVSLFGTQVFFRIELDPFPQNVRPLVVVRDGETGYRMAWFGYPVEPGVWTYNVMYGDGYPPDSEFAVYLIAR